MTWNISDSEIQEVERLLLPSGCHFADDALQVIKHWNSVDVSACPGSGKTTVLLAKLKLLADRMPLENAAGVCVLSHTNVAINEIRNKLTGCADKLMSYPNFIGTIQSFIDKFVTMPYIRREFGRSVQVLDNRTYSQHLLYKISSSSLYSALKYTINHNYENSRNRLNDKIEYVEMLYIRNDGALCIKSKNTALASKDTLSAQQFNKVIKSLIQDEGIIRYQDTFKYADSAIAELSDQYTSLFCSRFHYVYIDEYQDCSKMQKDALSKLFNPNKCFVTHIGDPDQAIYNSDKDETTDWSPCGEFLSIASSCRYQQEIANVLSPLRKDKVTIQSSLTEKGLKPILIIYNNETISKVLDEFVSLLDEHGLHDPTGIYKAIGFAKKKTDSAGKRLGSYWEQFDSSTQQQRNEYKHWSIIDDICSQLQLGKLYKAEILVRRLLCKLFHYGNLKDEKSLKDYSISSINIMLKEKYYDFYTNSILSLSNLKDYNRESIDGIVRTTAEFLYQNETRTNKSLFGLIPNHFMENPSMCYVDNTNQNVYIEPLCNRHIQFNTVHGVKGETHDATLYLETETNGGSDISRILYCYGVGKEGSSPLYNYSRKIVYVGMSRPRKLLCVAIQESTYNKGKNGFLEWEIKDLRQ